MLLSILALCARESTWCEIQGNDRPGFCGQEIIPCPQPLARRRDLLRGKRAAAATTTPTTAR
eukprot:4757083-Prymnesium_polylepis.1